MIPRPLIYRPVLPLIWYPYPTHKVSPRFSVTMQESCQVNNRITCIMESE
jgi:hypothetical protein